MRKTFDIVGWVCVFFTILALIFTLLATYHIKYIKYFDDYYVLQWCMFFTMSIWGIKLFDFKENMRLKMKDFLYPSVYITMALFTIFFMYMKVK